jgi:hypothetical protein
MGFSATFLVFDWPVIDISGCFQKALVVQAGGVGWRGRGMPRIVPMIYP